MDIKQENVNLLLGKIKELLGSLPEEVKKGGKFLQAEQALEKLNELLSGLGGEDLLKGCRGKNPAM